MTTSKLFFHLKNEDNINGCAPGNLPNAACNKKMTARSRTWHRDLKKERKALSPAVSTVILTGAIVMLVLIALNFSNSFLTSRIVENEFGTAEQFMQTAGIQIDDVAWTIGRTQTIRYTSQYGQVNFVSQALNYTVYVNKGSGYVFLANYNVGIIMFNMPLSTYSLGNGYYKRIVPSSDGSFLQQGTSAPVSFVYSIEKLPMSGGSYLRVVVAPCIRMLNSSISTGGGGQTNYFNFYLPVLQQGLSPYHSQSFTLTGTSVSFITQTVNAIKIDVAFPKASSGYDANFFKFDNTEEIVNVPTGSILQFYTGGVTASMGLAY